MKLETFNKVLGYRQAICHKFITIIAKASHAKNHPPNVLPPWYRLDCATQVICFTRSIFSSDHFEHKNDTTVTYLHWGLPFPGTR